MATKKAAAPKQADVLEDLVRGDPQRVMALILWKNRLNNPDMFVQIGPNDVKGLDDCCRYLKVNPRVKVFRPEGVPASPGIPAAGNRRAVPARPAIPPRDYVMVTLVDEKGDVIRPVENNQDDFDAAAEAGRVRKARDDAPSLAERIVAGARSGETSLSDITDAANALLLLSRSA